VGRGRRDSRATYAREKREALARSAEWLMGTVEERRGTVEVA